MWNTKEERQVDLTQTEKRVTKQASAQKRITAQKVRGWFGKFLVYVILTVGAIIFIAPWAWMVSASFQPIGKIFDWPPNWIPDSFTFNNYVRFLRAEGFFRWVLNSAFLAAMNGASSTMCCSQVICYTKNGFDG